LTKLSQVGKKIPRKENLLLYCYKSIKVAKPNCFVTFWKFFLCNFLQHTKN